MTKTEEMPVRSCEICTILTSDPFRWNRVRSS